MLCSLNDLLSQPMTSVPFYCFPFLPFGGRMLIGAPPKSFKSMLALNIAYDLAEGTPVLGHKVLQPLAVLVIEQEIGLFRLRERLRIIHSVRAGSVAPYNLYLVSKDLTINLYSKSGRDHVKRYLEACKPSVLILDPLRKIHRGRESESDDMVDIFSGLDELQQGNLATIIVHHTGKRAMFRRPGDPESLRGSSEIFADADTVCMIENPIPGCKKRLQLTFTLRSAEEPPPYKIQFDEKSFTFTAGWNG